ncbi:bifunctional riboflavin kinase/FMN phosphatase-like isoform X1 [Phoenix dactylifera]|uniref:riboflavin kinase n=1 Tax=Phoenix dactylifera TaxID=42345 RepID=A0A8B7D5P0_PHODC|nr:bifunctional riboflavin kinase/FMN phosphatase-like isoform X1 [Phoenix dactylifera]
MEKDRLLAVILDLDGTLLDTERATKNVLKEFLARYGKVPDAEKEERRLGQMQKEAAAAIVKDYDLPLTADEFSEAIMPMYQEKLPQAKALPGVNRLIRHLHKHGVPLALASNSIRRHIETKISHQQGWKESFSVILGGDDVKHGKPSPDIFLEAAKRLGIDSSACLVIEDSPVGVRAAKASGAKVVAVPSLQCQDERYSIANCVLHSLLEFQPELWGLPAFEDWVQNALPIEPLYAKDLLGELFPHDGFAVAKITEDNASYEFVPDQVCGVFFGWAKLEIHGIFKVVVSIGWDISLGTVKRVTELRLISHINSYTKERLHLLFVGYIRKLRNEQYILEALKLSEEDVIVARDALDLPSFSHQVSSPLFAEAILEEES